MALGINPENDEDDNQAEAFAEFMEMTGEDERRGSSRGKRGRGNARNNKSHSRGRQVVQRKQRR